MDVFCCQGLPCHLYFDLEFNWKDNAEKNGDEMVDLLLSVIFDALCEKYSIQGNHDCVVELDSSTKGMLFYRTCHDGLHFKCFVKIFIITHF